MNINTYHSHINTSDFESLFSSPSDGEHLIAQACAWLNHTQVLQSRWLAYRQLHSKCCSQKLRQGWSSLTLLGREVYSIL
eukprot:s25_g21.t1